MRQRTGPHVRAVRKDLQRLPREDRLGGLAALALTLARRLDEGDAGLRDTAAISRELHAILQTLAKKQEPAAVLDPINELEKARTRRLRDAAG